MIVLDTNVVSELMRPQPTPQVETWLATQVAADIYLTTVSEAELRHGAAILPAGRRRDKLVKAINDMLDWDFRGRILPFDRASAAAYALIAAARRSAGRPISQFDCQIAAIARSRGFVVATHNIGDYTGCGVELIDPWRGS